jgi:hypothetical protein
MYYTGMIFTYKLDQTTVTVGAKYVGDVDKPDFGGLWLYYYLG